MEVTFKRLTKRYGGQAAVDAVDLAIGDGEFFTLLGPSGCGKTTLLRMAAGFVTPDQGDILFGGQVMNAVPPHRRETGMVFQNYALFPHLSVFENVAYGLKARAVPAGEIRARVAEMLASVHLEGLEGRLPGQLSGGQQQRVALARALVIRPRVLLMDEPLSNLDARLRVSMREEIRRTQKRLGITTVYVTHDQEEAMAVSDRIAILRGGRLQQAGRPADIYYAPANRFAAEFMGACNLVQVAVRGFDPATGLASADLAGSPVRFAAAADPGAGPATLLLRPDWITPPLSPDDRENLFPATVRSAMFLGASAAYEVALADGTPLRVDVRDPGRTGILAEGDPMVLRFNPARPVVIGE
jgi:iron(III) transport system ATP-binding protein